MHRSICIVVAAALLGCSGATSPALRLIAATALSSYVPGDSVVVRFVNVGEDALQYNGCYAGLERWSRGGWRTAGPASGTVPCLSNLRVLASAASDSVTFGLAPGLPAGAYRYVFSTFAAPGGTITAGERTSNAFQVR